MKPPSQPNAINKLFQGNQSPASALFGQPDPTQPPQPGPAAAPPAASSPQPAPSSASSPTPAPVQPGALSAAMKPPQSEQDFAASNPDATKAYMPTRPVGDFDTGQHPVLRHALASLFAGLAEFGRPGSGLSMAERWNDQATQQRQFDNPANQEKMKAGALNQAYQKYLTEGGQQAQIEHEQAETQNLHANVPLLQHQQQFLDKVRGLKESGKYGSDEELFNSVLPEAGTIPGLTRQMIVDQINNAKSLGAQFNVQTDKQGRPEFVQDRTGKKFYPDTQGKFADPEMQKQWDSEMSAHQTSRGEKLEDEKNTAVFAATRQAQAFSNQQNMEATKKMQPAVDTALTADDRLARMEKSFTKGMAGDQQAQLALLADHLGMTFGMQKGAKLNRGLIEEAQQSQPWLSKISAKFDKDGYLSGVALGPEQMKQMLDLGYDARDRAWQGAHNTATTYGVALPPGAEKVEQQRQPGSKPMLQQQGGQGGAKHVPGGQAQGLKEGATGTGSDGKKYVVKGGVWVPQ